MTRDMTTGRPSRLILSFFFPVLLGELLQQVYVLTDTAIVGRFVGVRAFAAISSTGALSSLVVGFVIGLCYGLAVPIAQAFGAGDLPGMRRYFSGAVLLCAAITGLLTLLTVPLTPAILRLLGTPPELTADARIYIRILFGGMGATALYNLASSALRAVGNTRAPLFFLVLSCVGNVLLDLLFVPVLQLGAAGAALATVCAQLIAGLLCAGVIVHRYDALRIHRGEWRPQKARIRYLLAVALPMGLESSLTAIGSVILQRAVNALGTVAVAAVAAGDRVMFALSAPFGAIGATLATYCGQNFGAGRMDRLRRGVRLSLAALLVYCVAAFLMQRACGTALMRLFIDPGEGEILSLAARYLHFACLFFPGFLCIMALRNALLAMGRSRTAMLAGAFETAARLIVALLLIPAFGFAGACAGHPLAWVLGSAFLIPAYLHAVRDLA